MPKGDRRAVRPSSGYYNLSPASTPTSQYAPMSSRSMPVQQETYYTTSIPQQHQYQTQPQPSYAQGGPVQHPSMSVQQPTYGALPVAAPPQSIRASSGAWSPTDDQTLMAARSQGMNWAPIQQAYFPSKTPNACRKRHERLMERRSADDWDGLKLENMAKTYMGMRREIWQGLAAQTGEKWHVVEQKCMSQGLKNLQTAARAHARRERLIDGASRSNMNFNDSGISDDLDPDYDNGSDRSSTYGGQSYGHHHSHSHSHSHSNGSVGYVQQGRLPSMDMGIDSIINRPGHARG